MSTGLQNVRSPGPTCVNQPRTQTRTADRCCDTGTCHRVCVSYGIASKRHDQVTSLNVAETLSDLVDNLKPLSGEASMNALQIFTRQHWVLQDSHWSSALCCRRLIHFDALQTEYLVKTSLC